MLAFASCFTPFEVVIADEGTRHEDTVCDYTVEVVMDVEEKVWTK
jgi:hypothetical protein